MRGLLNINKPAGISSYDVIRKLKPVLRPERIGHAGTLDPMATGVLLVLLNEATKVSRLLLELPKEYEAEITLGIQTDTDDITGRVVSQGSVPGWGFEELNLFLKQNFQGELIQVPPVFSALKQNGTPLYRWARAGKAVQAPARKVRIYEIMLLGWEPPRARISVRVSSGTYIRALARDIGRSLGCGATLSGLVRTGIGGFTLKNSLNLSQLLCPGKEVNRLVVPIETALSHLRKIEVSREQAQALIQGKRADWTEGEEEAGDQPVVAVTPNRDFLALVRIRFGVLIPERIVYAE